MPFTSPLESFKVGQGLGEGQSTLGHAVKTFLERYNKTQELRGEAQFGLQKELLLEQAKNQMASERRKSLFSGAGGSEGFVPTQFEEDGVTFKNPALEAKMAGAKASAARTPQQDLIVQNFESALSSARDIRNLYKEGGKMSLIQSSLPGAPGARRMSAALGNASDLLLRLRSGAQINEREFRRLRELLPNGWDAVMGEPGTFEFKMSRYESGLSKVLSRQRNRGFGIATETDDFEQEIEEVEPASVSNSLPEGWGYAE